MTVCKNLWYNAEVDLEGKFQPCSAFEGTIDSPPYDLEGYHASADFVRICRDQGQGLHNPECRICWDLESQGHRSLRQSAEQDLPRIDLEPQLRVLDYSLDHLCNLKCLMCNEQASSAILAEKLSLGQKIMPVRLAKDSTRLDFLAQHLDQLTELKIYNSGEPMMSPLFQPLIKLIHERNPEIKLMISTNATAVTAQTVDQLSKIKNLSVKISIDGHGRVNEFIRYPSKWPAIEQGVGLLKQLGHDKLLVHSTVQALNYYQLGQLLKWCWENNLSYECSPVKRISMLDQRVIPEASREIYKTKIIELCKIPQVKLSMHSGVIKTLLATARSIDSGEFCPQSHQQLKNHLDNLCSIRKIDLVEYLPVESELLELIS